MKINNRARHKNDRHLVVKPDKILYNEFTMSNISYRYLKSGTDVRGYAVASGGHEVTLTSAAVYDITGAFLKWLSQKTGKTRLKIAVGHDVRISCPSILLSLKYSAMNSGADVLCCGLCSTPSMFMLLKNGGYDCDASIMITASHLPFDRNGLKFFTPEGGLEGDDISQILEMAENRERLEGGKGSFKEIYYLDDYCRDLVNMVRNACGSQTPLAGKRIIVDAGNGAGSFFTDKVLKPLGADTTGSQFLEPDGTFPNHIPNPEDKQAIDSLKTAVLATGANLGIIFDTDVDRAGLVDNEGNELNRNRLIALTAATLDDEKASIVTDSVTSDGLRKFLAGRGYGHVRFKRGYKNVIDEAVRRNNLGENCPLAMETSGHAAFRDNYFLDDGAYLVCRLLIAMAKQAQKGERLISLISDLETPAEESEVRIKFSPASKNFRTEGQRVIDELTHFFNLDKRISVAPDNYEGVRVNFDEQSGNGWTLIRMSVHDPVMPINFESAVEGGNAKMAKYLLGILRKFPFLDVSALEKFIG